MYSAIVKRRKIICTNGISFVASICIACSYGEYINSTLRSAQTHCTGVNIPSLPPDLKFPAIKHCGYPHTSQLIKPEYMKVLNVVFLLDLLSEDTRRQAFTKNGLKVKAASVDKKQQTESEDEDNQPGDKDRFERLTKLYKFKP